MHERLTWNPIDPAPYASAWSTFAKLIALNFIKPLDIVELIARTDMLAPKDLQFRDSEWIDFERYGKLLGVAPDRLRSGFLDQLGFPRIKRDSDGRGIRFCPECLKLGYHSVLFELALVAECPLHGCKLSDPCVSCCRAIFKKGLIRTARPHRISGGCIHDEHWRSDIYSSDCQHISFDPELVSHIEMMDRDTAKSIRLMSDKFVRWWRRAFSADDGRSVCIADLARLYFAEDVKPSLGWELDFARTVAGSCPWPTSVDPLPADYAHLPSGKLYKTRTEHKVSLNSDLGRIYKAIRRHLFMKYVKPSHLSCWKELSSYDRESSLAISSHRVCTLVLAFMAWRMSIEGFSNVEGFRVRRSVNDYVWSFVSPHSGAMEVATFWYVQFFAVLGKLQEKLKSGGHLYINRSDIGVGFHGVALKSTMDETNGVGSNSWWLLFPNKENVARKAWARCPTKRRGESTMIHLSARYSLWGWSWTEYYSESNRPLLLFRIKDDHTMMKHSNSYIHITL